MQNVLADAQAEDRLVEEPQHPKIIDSEAELEDKVVPEYSKLQAEQRSELSERVFFGEPLGEPLFYFWGFQGVYWGCHFFSFWGYQGPIGGATICSFWGFHFLIGGATKI